MANDINEAISANDIKNGTVVVTIPPTGPTAKLKNNNYVLNTPAIASIQSKYDDRFDDITYYCIGSGTLLGG